MYRIIDSKSTGKTSRLMLLAKEHNGVIVCNNPESLRQKAYSYGIVGIEFVSYRDYIDGAYTAKNVYIDELDMFLKFYDCYIQGYTLSEE